MVKDKIVKNRIDIEFLSHLIFLPDFQFDAYTLFDVKKVHAISDILISELKSKQC